MKFLLTMFLLALMQPLSRNSLTLKTVVELGRKSKGCEGSGICFIRTTSDAKANSCNLTLSGDGATLLLEGNRDLLESKEGQLHNGRFVQEEEYPLPDEVCIGLDIPVGTVIPAGRFPVHIEGETCIICFTLLPETTTGTY